ncbi:MAG: hypothetical protein ACRCTU_12110 [Zoogloea sp.]|uniref:hypothetical protein n=1 Tax=Zoogloea sp. TaxID=49181 RepID=UPI003F3ED416
MDMFWLWLTKSRFSGVFDLLESGSHLGSMAALDSESGADRLPVSHASQGTEARR